MTSVDQKAPPEAPGSADLLESLVQEHLARATDAARQMETDATADALASPEPPPTEEFGAENVDLLRKEIEALLHGGESSAPPADAPGATDPLMSASPAAPLPAAEAPHPAPEMEKVSPAELDVLLAGDAARALAAEPVVPAAGVTAEQDDQLTEAEGVLADELAKLIAETTPGAAPAAAAPAVPVEEAPRRSSPAIVDESASSATSAAVISAQEPLPEAAASTPAAGVAAEAAAPAQAAPQAEAPAEKPQAVLAPQATEAAAAPAPVPRAGGRVQGFFESLALMVAQLIDLPFWWMDDLDKNVLGVVAVLWMLGGVLMFILSRVMG